MYEFGVFDKILMGAVGFLLFIFQRHMEPPSLLDASKRPSLATCTRTIGAEFCDADPRKTISALIYVFLAARYQM